MVSDGKPSFTKYDMIFFTFPRTSLLYNFRVYCLISVLKVLVFVRASLPSNHNRLCVLLSVCLFVTSYFLLVCVMCICVYVCLFKLGCLYFAVLWKVCSIFVNIGTKIFHLNLIGTKQHLLTRSCISGKIVKLGLY